MKVLAVIPAYQAAPTVRDVVQRAVSLFSTDGPVVVVDDGSTDDTGNQATCKGALVVRHARNRGKGAALRTGLSWARRLGADCAVTLDADGQHPPEEALALLSHPAPREAMLLAIRDLEAAGAPENSRLSNGISNFFLSKFSGQKLADTQCGLRRYPLPETLNLGAWADGFAYEAEVLLRAARAGWRIEQLPVRVWYPPRAERVSHFQVVRDPTRIIATVLMTLATTKRRR